MNETLINRRERNLVPQVNKMKGWTQQMCKTRWINLHASGSIMPCKLRETCIWGDTILYIYVRWISYENERSIKLENAVEDSSSLRGSVISNSISSYTIWGLAMLNGCNCESRIEQSELATCESSVFINELLNIVRYLLNSLENY